MKYLLFLISVVTSSRLQDGHIIEDDMTIAEKLSQLSRPILTQNLKLVLIKLNDQNITQNDFYTSKDNYLHTIYNQHKTEYKTKTTEFNFTSPQVSNVDLQKHRSLKYWYDLIRLDDLLLSKNISINNRVVVQFQQDVEFQEKLTLYNLEDFTATDNQLDQQMIYNYIQQYNFNSVNTDNLFVFLVDSFQSLQFQDKHELEDSQIFEQSSDYCVFYFYVNGNKRQYYLVGNKSRFEGGQFRSYIKSFLKYWIEQTVDNEQLKRLLNLYDQMVMEIAEVFGRNIDREKFKYYKFTDLFYFDQCLELIQLWNRLQFRIQWFFNSLEIGQFKDSFRILDNEVADELKGIEKYMDQNRKNILQFYNEENSSFFQKYMLSIVSVVVLGLAIVYLVVRDPNIIQFTKKMV